TTASLGDRGAAAVWPRGDRPRPAGDRTSRRAVPRGAARRTGPCRGGGARMVAPLRRLLGTVRISGGLRPAEGRGGTAGRDPGVVTDLVAAESQRPERVVSIAGFDEGVRRTAIRGVLKRSPGSPLALINQV